MEDKVIFKKKIDFSELKNWEEKEDSHFPVLSFVQLYMITGIVSEMKKFFESSEENKNRQICAVQDLKCNFYTLQKIRNLIKDNWEYYPIQLLGDNHLEWKKDKRHERLKHPRTLTKRMKTAITIDFANYSLGVDDEIEDDVIAFVDQVKEGSKNE